MTAPGYARSTGTPRGEARKQELLAAVVDDLVAHGLGGFSLRRAARAAATTHKVLLYHFDGVDDLLLQAVVSLRRRRVDRGVAAAGATGPRFADRIRAVWPVLTSGESAVLDQVIGLAIHDPVRHGALAREATADYLPALVALCPPDWDDHRKAEVSAMVLATLRGFLVDLRTTGRTDAVDAGFAALARALDREEDAGSGA